MRMKSGLVMVGPCRVLILMIRRMMKTGIVAVAIGHRMNGEDLPAPMRMKRKTRRHAVSGE